MFVKWNNISSGRALAKRLWKRSLTTNNQEQSKVYVQDSLRRKRLPMDLKRSKQGVVTFYCCGPTVYDSAHMGHARTYVHFDTIRRILEGPGGMQVAFFMNVTDVDLKILNRSKESGIHWKELATKFENEFFEDLDCLGVLRPTFTPRATEYIDEIIQHIETLQQQGLAYNGGHSNSVYFDTSAYDHHVKGEDTYRYGALDPSRRLVSGESAHPYSPDDGETALHTQEKKSPSDFALWKVDHEGKNATNWPSPWGDGLPGWHSECTAMVFHTAGLFNREASGGGVDIHGGGVDLKFPHHENERVQGQAMTSPCCGNGDNHWSTYFLHTGHLHIQGKKMSKSLKNFLTIRQLLGLDGQETIAGFPVLSPRQARLLFLSVKYNYPMELDAEMMRQVQSFDSYLSEFFMTCEFHKKEVQRSSKLRKWQMEDVEALNTVETFDAQAKLALLDDFDTPRTLGLIRELVNQMNRYIRSDMGPQVGVLNSVCSRLFYVFEILGIGGQTSTIPSYGNLTSHNKSEGGDSQPSSDEILNILVEFRKQIRSAAKAKDLSLVFRVCDSLRDHELPKIGVRVDDQAESHGAFWSYCTRKNTDVLHASQENVREAVQKSQTQTSTVPKEYLSQQFGELYSIYDDMGIPTHNADGSPVSKNARKKLEKKLAKYTAQYEGSRSHPVESK